MQLLARAVVTGFGLALGGALYKKLARKIGFEEPEAGATAAPRAAAATEPTDDGDDGELVQAMT